MIYYRVKPEKDNVRRAVSRKMGSIYRNGMAQALRDTYTHTEPVNISPKETYWFFGVRFQNKEG